MAYEMAYGASQGGRRMERPIKVELTKEEAWEILTRCMTSAERDNQVFSSALVKFAKALEKEGPRPFGSA